MQKIFLHRSNRAMPCLWFLASWVFFGTPVYAIGLNDTGIKTCSNATQNGLPCPVVGFPGQDAQFGTNAFSFTKLDANGNPMSVTATNHSCVKDNVTGLIWEGKTDDGGLHDKDNVYDFYRDGFADMVNRIGLCGHKDWRMPTQNELASIIDYSIAWPGPTIDTGYFVNTVNSFFWTVNASFGDGVGVGRAWIADFNRGCVQDISTYYAHAIRLVRGGHFLLPSFFTDQGDGTIKDNNTSLMWAKCSQGQTGTDCSGSASGMNWASALMVADSSSLVGFTDWRLPNVKELQSIVNYSTYDPAIIKSYFPNTSRFYWTASASVSTYVCDAHIGNVDNGAWTVNFDDGDVIYLGRSQQSF